MVFTKLSAQEKDAFFGLLDEYFQSRPELFGQGGEHDRTQGASGLGGTRTNVGLSSATAASVVQRALVAGGAPTKSRNPYYTAAGSSMVTTVLSGNNNDDGNDEHDSTNADGRPHDIVGTQGIGRVAAAARAFSGGSNSNSNSNSNPPTPQPSFPPPPILPRRVSSTVPAAFATEHVCVPGLEVDKLVTKKTSVLSAFSSKKAPQASVVAIPPAFPTPKNVFGPPPVRRTTSTGTGGAGASGARATGEVGGPPRSVLPAPRRPEEVEATETEAEAEGEWAEVLYDYDSEDPGDLVIEAGTRVFVTVKSSEDWWTGQVEGQGREGLFPASYVKLL